MQIQVPDCRLTLEVRDCRVTVQMEHLTIQALATMCGALQTITGAEAVAGGTPLDEVRTHMLDIHLAAMETLADQVIKGKEGSGGDDKT